MSRLVVSRALVVLILSLAPLASAGENGVYDESFLSGQYFATDLFALDSGEGVQTWGFRAYDGDDTMSSIVNFASRSPLTYQVDGDGAMRLYQGTFDTGYSASVGLNGALTIWSPAFARNGDPQVTNRGYGALRLSMRQGSGMRDSDFEGDYSQHGIAFDGIRWWNLFGGVDADGVNTMRIFRGSGLAATQSFNVTSNGAVDIGGTNGGLAALGAGGDLLIHSADVRANVDTFLPGGFEGLLLYVRRSPPDKGLDATSFRGRYRIHELRIRPLGTVDVKVGEVEAGGPGLFFGTLDGQPFDGTLSIFPSGVFSMSNRPDAVGTLGVNGDVAVVTRENGQVNGGSGEVWMQIWARTAGGEGNALDADGDGLSDADEAALNTNANNPDSDNDGLIDGLDDRPRNADNIVSATLDESELNILEGEDVSDPVTLTLDTNDYPFFAWSITSDQPWAALNPDEGLGDGTVSITLDTADLSAADSPHEATLRITAPGMQTVAPVVLTVNVQQPGRDLITDPTELQFEAMQGGLDPDAETVALSAVSGDTDFDWVVESTANWLQAEPNTGTGPGNVDIVVNVAGLFAVDSPHTATLRFREDIDGAPAFDLPVTLLLSPPRVVGEAFQPEPPTGAQSRPSAAYDPALDRYVLAWEQSNTIRAMVLDGEGVPRLASFRVPLIALGPPRKPQVVMDTTRSVAWIIWEQEAAGGGGAFISARTINLNTFALSNVFGLASALDELRDPLAHYNPTTDEIVVVATLETNNRSGVELFRVDPVTRTQIARSTPVAAGDIDSERRVSALAWDAVNNRYLLAWEESVSPLEVTTVSTYLQMLSAADGAILGDPATLNQQLDRSAGARMSYLPGEDAWAVVWNRYPTATADVDVLLQRFAGADLTAVTEVETREAITARETPSSTIYNPVGEQVLWAYPTADQTLAGERRTRANFAFPETEELSAGVSDQIAAIYNAARNEFFLVWRAPNAQPAAMTALRLDAGTVDEDEDTLPNDWEFEYDLDPFDATGENGATGDPDEDFLDNATEFLLGTDPRLADSDGDGLLDWQEDRNRDGMISDEETNPALADTDDDGASDGAEWFLSTSGTDDGDFPDTAIYRIEYGTFAEGTVTPVRVHLHIAEADTYTLDFRGPGSPLTPGWSVSHNALTRNLAPGSQVYEFQIAPTGPITPVNDHANFRFSLRGELGGESVMNAVFVVDNRETRSGEGVDNAGLAVEYAPIIRFHRDEPVFPIDPEFLIGESGFDRGNTRPLMSDPTIPFDLFQSPQSEAELDLPGASVDVLRNALPPSDEQPLPRVFYTVAELGDQSLAADPPEDHLLLQYYLYFPADAWGFGQLGGHQHEGDWEVVQILFDEDEVPYRITTTQQWQLARDGEADGGASLAWDAIETMDGTHPVIYAGRGGHSLYFRSGLTNYDTGIETYDGYGAWASPAVDDFYVVATDYDPLVPYELAALPRLGEADAFLWQRYAGRWGQRNYPAQGIDTPTPSTTQGPLGPVFLGTTDDPLDPDRVASLWSDPWAWAMRTPEVPDERMTEVVATFDPIRGGQEVVLLDARGRIFRGEIRGDNGLFELDVPRQHYTVSLVSVDTDGRDTHIATAVYETFIGETLLLPATRGGVVPLGTYLVDGTRMEGNPVYEVNDTDGDGTVDFDDADQDGDGFINTADDDELGDGYDDRFQMQDPDGDGIPNYFDTDDDGDDIPDAEDEDRNGNEIPDVDEPADFDGDGVVDAADLDIDNDTFTNLAEQRAGTDPYNFLDTPARPLGDLDQDGDLDAADLQQLVNRVLGRGPYNVRADFDGNGRNDAADVDAVVFRILSRLGQ